MSIFIFQGDATHLNAIVERTNRKLRMALADIVTGLAMVFGVEAGEIMKVAGVVGAIASIITYILAEGKVDAAALQAPVYTSRSYYNSAKRKNTAAFHIEK